MFKRLEDAFGLAVTVYLSRAAVSALFVVAGGFFVTALIIWLAQRYDSETACLIVAASFAFLGLIGMAVVGVRSEEASQIQSQAEAGIAGAVGATVAATAASAATQELPMALAGALLTGQTPEELLALATKLGLAIGRNWPLVALLGALTLLLLPQRHPRPGPAKALEPDHEAEIVAAAQNGANRERPNLRAAA